MRGSGPRWARGAPKQAAISRTTNQGSARSKKQEAGHPVREAGQGGRVERQSKGGIGGGLPSPQHRRRAVTHRRLSRTESRVARRDAEDVAARTARFASALAAQALGARQSERAEQSTLIFDPASLATGAQRLARGVSAPSIRRHSAGPRASILRDRNLELLQRPVGRDDEHRVVDGVLALDRGHVLAADLGADRMAAGRARTAADGERHRAPDEGERGLDDQPEAQPRRLDGGGVDGEPLPMALRDFARLIRTEFPTSANRSPRQALSAAPSSNGSAANRRQSGLVDERLCGSHQK